MRTKPTKCLSCNAVLDAQAPVGDNVSAPREGDVSLCAYCCNVSKFDADLNLRPITEQEKEDLIVNDNEVWQQLVAAKEFFTQLKLAK